MKIIDKILFQLRKIKWAYQRVKKGYSSWDVGDIDVWFLEVIPKMLNDFKQTHQGIPNCVFIDYFDNHPELGTYEEFAINWNKEIEDKVSLEWNKILDRMIFCFTEADEDKCSLANKSAKPEEIDEYCDQMLKEGFELFYKYFHNLWN